MSIPVPPPRSRPTRVLLTGLFDLAVVGSASVPGAAIADLTGITDLGFLAYCAISALIVAWLGPRVSYRAALLGPWLFWVIAWRVTYLPYRDWPPQDDEVSRAHYIREAEFAREWKPEYAGLWRLRQTNVYSDVSS
jgi:hypothetical protein